MQLEAETCPAQGSAVGRQPRPPALVGPLLMVRWFPVLTAAEDYIQPVRLQVLPAAKPVRPEGHDHLTGRIVSYPPNQAQRDVDVSPAIEDPQDRMAPCAGLLEQSLGSHARLGVTCLRPDRKLIEPAKAALKLALQVLVAVTALLHNRSRTRSRLRRIRSVASWHSSLCRANTGEPSSPPRYRPGPANASRYVTRGHSRPSRDRG